MVRNCYFCESISIVFNCLSDVSAMKLALRSPSNSQETSQEGQPIQSSVSGIVEYRWSHRLFSKIPYITGGPWALRDYASSPMHYLLPSNPFSLASCLSIFLSLIPARRNLQSTIDVLTAFSVQHDVRKLLHLIPCFYNSEVTSTY